MTALRGWGLPEQHLALDALVAFVDGELTPTAYDRAAAHLAGCPSCAADAAAQRQARSAVRRSAPPSMSPQFLQTLQGIPASAELPPQPDGLALTENGQLVTVNHKDRATKLHTGSALGATATGGATALGLSEPGTNGDVSPADHPDPSKGHGRRAKQGAGVVFSGLVLGALAFMNVPADTARNTVTTVPGPLPLGDTTDGGVRPATTTAPLSTTPMATPGPAASTRATASGGAAPGDRSARQERTPDVAPPTFSTRPPSAATGPVER